MIDLHALADDLSSQPDGTWNSGAARNAWERLQIAVDRDPLTALAITSLVVQNISPAATAKIASRVLRSIIESADETMAKRLAEYSEDDDRMHEAIAAVDRYLQKVRLLRLALRNGNIPSPLVSFMSSFPLPNAYGDRQRLGDVFPEPAAINLTGNVDELFDSFDVLVSNDPRAAWRSATEVATRAVSERDKLIVAQSMSRLLNLNEALIAADVAARLRASRPLREVMARCRYAVSEPLLDALLEAVADTYRATRATP
jgi:hypothetical protein